MEVLFYNCTADVRRVNKQPYMTYLTTKTITSIGNMDIIYPDFTVDFVSSYPIDMNYLHIPDLQRYYFIKGMEEIAGHALHLTCEVDVAMSFLNNKSFPVTVIRNENIKNSNIKDTALPIDPQFHEPEVIPISTSLFQRPSGTVFGGSPQWYDVIEIQ